MNESLIFFLSPEIVPLIESCFWNSFPLILEPGVKVALEFGVRVPEFEAEILWPLPELLWIVPFDVNWFCVY